eukprot:3479394-Amphidinium_carterae.1
MHFHDDCRRTNKRELHQKLLNKRVGETARVDCNKLFGAIMNTCLRSTPLHPAQPVNCLQRTKATTIRAHRHHALAQNCLLVGDNKTHKYIGDLYISRDSSTDSRRHSCTRVCKPFTSQ